MSKDSVSTYTDVLYDDESLTKFVNAMRRFDKNFAELMFGNYEFTIKMEVHGNKGEMIHCRVHYDSFDAPKKSEVASAKRRKSMATRS